MTENGSAGDSVFLRAWDDYENTTIKLTAAPQPGVGRTNFRGEHPRGAAAAGGRDRGDRAGPRLGGRRPRLRPGLRLHRPGRARDGRLLRDGVVPADRRPRAGAEEPGAGLPGPRGERAADRPHQLPRPSTRSPTATSPSTRSAAMVTEQIVLDDGRRRQLDHVHQQGLRRGLDPGQHRHVRPAAPPVVRRRQPRRHHPGRRHRARAGRPHRDRAAQAHHPAELLPLRLGAGRQPDRAGQPGRPAGARPRLAADRLVGGGAGEGPGLGAADHLHVPHARHAAGGGAASEPADRGPRARRGGVGDRARPGRGGRRRPRLRPEGASRSTGCRRAAARPTRWPTPTSCSA